MLESFFLSVNSISSLRVLDPDKGNDEYVRNIEGCKYVEEELPNFLFCHTVGNNTKLKTIVKSSS